jgi:predicted acylesterase/phospholipase RssA
MGVAISGGGVRATFYSAGALLYLVHSGLNKNVRLISSVSGGSIGNTVVAMNCDFAQVNRDFFDPLISIMCHRLQRRGVFFLQGALITTFGGSLIATIPLWAFEIFVVPKQSEWHFDLNRNPYSFIGTVVILIIYAALARRQTQIDVYRRFLKSLFRKFNRWPAMPPQMLTDLPARQVAHCLCATELSSGQPILMTRRRLVSQAFGRSRSTKLSIAQAMYASAAFPVVFSPLKVRSEKLDFSGGSEDVLPKWLYLADGGVFNNLATDGLASLVASAAENSTTGGVPLVRRNLVINASAPPSTKRIRFFKINRIMTVMYESTILPRLQQLMNQEASDGGHLIIDVAESPVELAERIARGRSHDDPVAKRARASIENLGQIFTVAQWKDRANGGARTKTVLSRVKRQTAVRLVFLGYLNAAVSCHAHIGAAGVESVPREAWFGSLLDNKLSDAQNVGLLEAALNARTQLD